MKQILLIISITIIIGCQSNPKEETNFKFLGFSENILDYKFTPKHKFDKDGLMFSDQGSWFAYSLPKPKMNIIGFSGPFLMTQDNGVWSDMIMSGVILTEGDNNNQIIDFNKDIKSQNSYASHLEQILENDKLHIKIELIFLNGNTSVQRISIINKTEIPLKLNSRIQGSIFKDIGIQLINLDSLIKITSENTDATGYIKIDDTFDTLDTLNNGRFYAFVKPINIEPKATESIIISHSFIFPRHSYLEERKIIEEIDFDSVLIARKLNKNKQLESLIVNRKPLFQNSKYAEVLAKAHLTLQNNWRIPAGEIEHEGVFPSYHYKWFNGFWSWDSWKHAAALSYYDLRLAKEQVKLMFKFQEKDGFVADCVYRDITIEPHNYRNTKPPLSAWAVLKIYKKDNDLEFIRYMYPKLKKYHYWWYKKRDHDQDGLCEYGSTDGSLVAAKWESGMDNAIRFDNSYILKNDEGTYSLDQESVDLNAYLYAEKLFLNELAEALNLKDTIQYKSEAETLKYKIQTQFYDELDGWFYDTDLEGLKFIKGEGSEGWTSLWAKAVTQEQAKSVKAKMMDPNKFFTKVPFQTMTADHEKFDPLNGYWRGPNWLDQAYFGVKGFRNYGFNKEADSATKKILRGAEGLLGKGKSIRENYHPITGEGLNAVNFSWSAAHVIMLLLDE